MPKEEVAWTEELAKESRSDGDHGPGADVRDDDHEKVISFSGLMVAEVNSLNLEIRVAVGGSGGVDSELV